MAKLLLKWWLSSMLMLVTILLVYHINLIHDIIGYPSTTNQIKPPNATETAFDHYVLFLRMFHGTKELFYNDFFDTFKFFWPFNSIPANLLIVLDDESDLDHKWEIELRQKFELELANEIRVKSFNYYITYEKPNNNVYNYSGWNRQQWSMFWCDKFLNRWNISKSFEYIGFVDTDTLFTSIITPQTIFHQHNNIANPKPIVISQLGFQNQFFLECSKNTPRWFGKKELFRNMCQFPATFKISHIKDFREATVKYWFNDSYTEHHFDEIVDKLLKEPPLINASYATRLRGSKFFSQFNIFAIYVWNYAQNEYEWYFEPSNEWKMRKRVQNIILSMHTTLNFSTPALNVHDGNTESMIRIAVHEKYHPATSSQAIAKGYCFCISWNSKYCQYLNKALNIQDGVYDYLFQFEWDVVPWSEKRFEYQSLRTQNRYYREAQRIIFNHYWHRHPLIENHTMLKRAMKQWK